MIFKELTIWIIFDLTSFSYFGSNILCLKDLRQLSILMEIMTKSCRNGVRPKNGKAFSDNKIRTIL